MRSALGEGKLVPVRSPPPPPFPPFSASFGSENVDETLDPMIDPILEQATFMDGSQRMIVLDDKALPWDENFRLYLTSKLGKGGISSAHVLSLNHARRRLPPPSQPTHTTAPRSWAR